MKKSGLNNTQTYYMYRLNVDVKSKGRCRRVKCRCKGSKTHHIRTNRKRQTSVTHTCIYVLIKYNMEIQMITQYFNTFSKDLIIVK